MIDRERITALHDAAMAFADKGLTEREPAQARKWLRLAFENERSAAELLKDLPDEEPTRSVLYRSAATLAFDCKEYLEAERLVKAGLSGKAPGEIVEELKALGRRVRTELKAARTGSSRKDAANSQKVYTVLPRALPLSRKAVWVVRAGSKLLGSYSSKANALRRARELAQAEDWAKVRIFSLNRRLEVEELYSSIDQKNLQTA